MTPSLVLLPLFLSEIRPLVSLRCLPARLTGLAGVARSARTLLGPRVLTPLGCVLDPDSGPGVCWPPAVASGPFPAAHFTGRGEAQSPVVP